jgi:hypothetical protein
MLALILLAGLTRPAPAAPTDAQEPSMATRDEVFSLAGHTWTSKEAFIKSGARCATAPVAPSKAQAIELRLERFLAARGRGPGRSLERAVGSVWIPVYFHVIRTDVGATNGDVPESMLDDQITVLNQGYGGLTGGANTAFRFYKAGVTRTTNATWFAMTPGSAAEAAAKNALHTGGANALNLYTTNGGGLLGWSTFPWDYAARPNMDGVVVLYSSLPGGGAVPYDKGDTGTHEIGHWLGLLHTFQGGCSSPNDLIPDTPQESAPNFGCPAVGTVDSCPADAGADPVDNFMDYVDDGCMFRFTAAQTRRMDGMYGFFRDLRPDDIALTGVSGWNTLPLAVSQGNGGFNVLNPFVGDFATWSATPGAVKLTGDFNGDGWTDIALTGPSSWGSLPVAFATGAGTFNVTNFGLSNFPSWASTPGAIKITGDFNGDGLTDIALTGPSSWGSLPVAFSNGNGTFNVTNVGLANFPAWAATPGAVKLVGDFNGDGRADIALTGPSSWGSLPVAFSNGDGSFTVTNIGLANFPAWAATPGAVKLVGDFNGDGRADIALTGPSGWTTLPVAFSNGDGSFNVTNQWVGSFASWAATPGAVKLVGNFNGDSRADIALTGPSGWTTLPLACSNGDGTFAIANQSVGPFAGWSATPGAVKLVGDFQ